MRNLRFLFCLSQSESCFCHVRLKELYLLQQNKPKVKPKTKKTLKNSVAYSNDLFLMILCIGWAIPLLALSGLTHATAGIEFKMASFAYLAVGQGPQFFPMWSHPPVG